MVFEREFLGCINLDNWHIEDREVLNVFNSFSFICEGKKYFFKELKNSSQCYSELIGFELAKDYGLSAIPYDMASYDGFIGFLSSDYMKDEYVTMETILRNCYGNLRNKNNLDCVSIALKKIWPNDAEKVIKQLIDILMFDIIIANFDRHDSNIIVDTKEHSIPFVFDNEMLLDAEAMYDHTFMFGVFPGEDDVVQSLFQILDLNGLSYFLNKIEIINKENIQCVIKRVEDKIGCSMIEPLKEEVIKKFSINYRLLIDLIKKELATRKVLSKK